jgi:hypothetical protein
MRSSERSGNLSYREVVVLVYRCIAASHFFYWGRVISRSSSFFQKKRFSYAASTSIASPSAGSSACFACRSSRG